MNEKNVKPEKNVKLEKNVKPEKIDWLKHKEQLEYKAFLAINKKFLNFCTYMRQYNHLYYTALQECKEAQQDMYMRIVNYDDTNPSENFNVELENVLKDLDAELVLIAMVDAISFQGSYIDIEEMIIALKVI